MDSVLRAPADDRLRSGAASLQSSPTPGDGRVQFLNLLGLTAEEDDLEVGSGERQVSNPRGGERWLLEPQLGRDQQLLVLRRDAKLGGNGGRKILEGGIRRKPEGVRRAVVVHCEGDLIILIINIIRSHDDVVFEIRHGGKTGLQGLKVAKEIIEKRRKMLS